MPDSTVTIGGDISDLQTKLKQAAAGVRGFGDQSRRALTGIDLGKAFAVAGGISGLTSLLKLGFDFNSTMKDGEVAIGNVLKTFKGLNDEAAKSEAARVVQLIAEAEPRAAGGLKELTQGFIASAAAAATAGISTEENVDLVARFANALANSGLPLDQLNQEIRSVLTAQITGDSFVGKLLEGKGLGNERIKQLSAEGRLYGELVKTLGAMGEAGDTSAVAFSTLESAISKTAGYISAGLFDDAVAGAKDMAGWLETNKVLFQDLGVGIKNTAGFLAGFAAFMNDVRTTAAQSMGESVGNLMGFGNATTQGPQAKGFADKFSETQNEKSQPAPAPAPAPAQSGGSPAAESPATQSAKSLLAITRELEAVERMRIALGERQFQNLMHHLTPQLQIQAIERRIGEEMQRQIDLREQGPMDESTEITNAEKMLTLEEQLAKAKQARADAATAAATKEKEATDKLLQQAQNLADMQARTEILKAQAGGDDKKAAALQREVDIEQAKREILDQVAVSEAEALRMAQEQISLKEKIAANEAEGKDGTGKIDASIQPGGADAARARAEERVKASRDRVNSTMSDSFGSFAGEDARLKSKFSDQFGSVGGLPQDRQNPAAVQAGKNADSQRPPAAGGEATTVIELIRGILETIKA